MKTFVRTLNKGGATLADARMSFMLVLWLTIDRLPSSNSLQLNFFVKSMHAIIIMKIIKMFSSNSSKISSSVFVPKLSFDSTKGANSKIDVRQEFKCLRICLCGACVVTCVSSSKLV